ncbi:MAG: hypothetical protein O7F73_08185 [Gammaproteobacteria bacterium]|nr:hypothetical protein [Gammaproteobacteria bacterium]
MSNTVESAAGSNWFSGLKYLTYALLTVNVFMFLQEELLAAEHTFVEDFALTDLIQMFSATVDTSAWVILLLLFELETSVIPDAQIRGKLKLFLHGVRAICYFFIAYAFYGYLVELQTLYHVQVLSGDPCARAGGGWSVMVDLDEYIPLEPRNCDALGRQLWRLAGFNIVMQPGVLHAARMLAWTDVINAAAWILVVLVLETDVRLQLRGQLQGQALAVSKMMKAGLYSTLLFAAIYWGFAGDFLDFWDAFLWLFAFIFIELNVFSWQAETRGKLVGE